VLGGGVLPKNMDTACAQYLHYRMQIPLGKTAGDVRAVPSVNMILTRAAFDSVNGFCEDYLPLGEDWELCYRLRKAGHPVIYDPAPSVVHRYRPEPDRARRLMRIHGAVGVYISKGHYRSMSAYMAYSWLRWLCSPVSILRHYPLHLYLLALEMEWHFIYGRLYGYRAYLRGRKDIPS
jgi:GT2 family glycosyltransferase